MADTIDSLAIEITASASDVISKLQSLSSGLGSVKASSKGAASGMKAVNDSMEDVASSTQEASSNTRSFSDRIKSLTSGVSSVSLKLGNLGSVAKGAASAFNAFSAVPRYFGGQLVSSITSATNALTGFMGKIKSIILYRAIRSAIKEITKGISEGIKNLYHYSETFSGTFYQSMNQIATEAQYLKNSLGAMFQPLIEYITPFVTYITDKLVSIINLANQFFSALTGKSTYTAAKKVAAVWDSGSSKAEKATKKIKDNTKSTAKNVRDAANEFRRFTLAFDELNILGKNVTSSSGGGGGGSTGGLGTPTTGTTASTGTDYGSMFETKNVESKVKEFVDKIKALVSLQKWEAIGKIIGNKINDMVNSIPFAKYGAKVGTAINGWFTTKYWTLDTINFTNIGDKIAEFLNSAIKRISFNTIGRTMVQKLEIIGDLAIGFFTGFDWGQGARAFSDFTIGLYKEITKWFSKYNWYDLGRIIAEKLYDVIKNIDFKAIAKSFYEAMDSALYAMIGLLTGFVTELGKKLLPNVNWDELANKIYKNLDAIKAAIYSAEIVVGAILLFTWVKPALGLGLLAHGAMGMGKSISENFGMIQEKMKGWVKILTDTVGTALMLLGMLCLGTGHIAVGVGFLVTGALAKGAALTPNFSSVRNWLAGWVDELVRTCAGGLLMLGVIALAAHQYLLGVGLLVAGSVGLAKQTAANFSSIVTWISGWIEQFVEAVSKGLLFLGLICLVAQQYMLGIGLIVAGAAGLGLSKSFSATSLINWISGWLKAIVKVISEASIFLGVIALLSGNIPLGVGLIAAGLAGELAADYDWDNLKQLGIDAKNKFKEGWDSVSISFTSGLETVGKNLLSGPKNLYYWGLEHIFGEKVDKVTPYGVYQGAGRQDVLEVRVDAVPGDNFNKKIRKLELLPPETPKVEVPVSLMKKNWSTVVDWAYQQGMIDYDQMVALQKHGWTFIDKWCELFKGSTLFQSVSLLKVGWTVVSAWVEKAAGWVVSQAVGLAKDGWSWVDDWVSRWKGGTIWQSIGLSVSNWNSFLGGISKTLHSWFPTVFAEGGAIEHGKVSRFAGGGVINAYAGGTSSAHGSLFLAGEAGPEIVGHIGGRTEVLNKSQLAATMYAAVNAAMAPAAAGFASAAQYMYEARNNTSDEDMGLLLELVRAGSDAVQRQNDLMRQQNEYLRQINDKDFNPEISTANINRAQMRTNRRAGTTIVPLGT